MADLGCSPNATTAFDFLVSKGLSHEQAAGVVGNLQWESKLNPRLEVPDVNGLPGRGIAMWQPPRWRGLLAFAGARDPWALDTQLDFLWHELESSPSLGLAPLLASTTVKDATRVFQDQFERPLAAKAHTDNRIALANAALFACPLLKPPPHQKVGGVWAATAGALAIAAAAGYGVYKAFTSRAPRLPAPRPEPGPEPEKIRPSPAHFPGRVRPDFDYRDRL